MSRNFHWNERASDLRSFYRNAKRVEAHKGNAPGLPHQFAYLPGQEGALNSRKENIDFGPEPAMEIKQKVQESDITGSYSGGMVPELPFDMKGWEKTNELWTTLGFGCLLVGIILLMRSMR